MYIIVESCGGYNQDDNGKYSCDVTVPVSHFCNITGFHDVCVYSSYNSARKALEKALAAEPTRRLHLQAI